MRVMSSDAPARPAPMEPGGAYDRRSQVQAAGLLPAVELIEEAARDVELPHAPHTLMIADYGASAGHNSLLPLGSAITTLRNRAEPGRPIFVMHTDVAENGYTALFDTLAGDSHSYLRDDPSTFSAAVGRSIYEQVLPSNTVTLGWSSWAVQWLSRVAYSRDENAVAAYAAQAGEDWIAFLTARSRELVPGGQLVVLTMALDDGDFGYRPLVSAIVDELADMTRDGLVTAEEVRRMAIPTVGRSEAELTAPFVPKNRFHGMTIEHLELFDGEDQIWRRFQIDGDAAGYATRWTAFARTSIFPTLAVAVDAETDGPSAFFDRLTAGVTERMAADPQPVRIPLAKLRLVRRSWPR